MDQINEIAQGVERYFTENQSYPANVASIATSLATDEYFSYSLTGVGISSYTVQADKASGAAKFDLRMNHQGVQTHRPAGTGSWQAGWP
jgi:Tfp pilus assembly protein PilE